MTREEATTFALRWIEAWNSRDIEAVLSRFEETVEFTSPLALATVAVATVRGKPALRAYWQAALAAVTSLRFTLARAVWDPETRELAIVYLSEVNGQARRVSENLRFGENGLVAAAEVFHGVAMPTGPT
jgi:hypothetical protein